MRQKYGEPTKELVVYDWLSALNLPSIFIFEENKKIILKNTTYEFKDIIGYSLFDDNQTIITSSTSSTIKSNSGSVIGRTIGGAIIGGGVGAIVGGTTASKKSEGHTTSQTKTNHSYILNIRINDMSNPLISFNFFDKREQAEELATILEIIINMNNSN